jgi:hypothetical protein
VKPPPRKKKIDSGPIKKLKIIFGKNAFLGGFWDPVTPRFV